MKIDFSPLISSIRTLTVLPVPGKDCEVFTRCLPYFPVVGALLGAIACALAFLMNYLLPSTTVLAGILLTASMIFITGGLHLDGIADAADGFGGGKTKERILEIFKDSRLGTFGVTAVVIDIMVKAALYSYIISHALYTVLLAAFILSRSGQALSLTWLPYARAAGGTASVFTRPGSSWPAVLMTLFATIICIWAAGWQAGAIAVGAAAVTAALFLKFVIKKINGITGDCIGAVNEIIEIAALLSVSIFYQVTMQRGAP